VWHFGNSKKNLRSLADTIGIRFDDAYATEHALIADCDDPLAA
jgi:hypothetical protein